MTLLSRINLECSLFIRRVAHWWGLDRWMKGVAPSSRGRSAGLRPEPASGLGHSAAAANARGGE